MNIMKLIYLKLFLLKCWIGALANKRKIPGREEKKRGNWQKRMKKRNQREWKKIKNENEMIKHQIINN